MDPEELLLLLEEDEDELDDEEEEEELLELLELELLELDDEEELELLEDELLLEDEELPPTAGANTTKECGIWLVCEAVQLMVMLPLEPIAVVDPALPEPDEERSQRSVCPAAAVKLTLPDALPTTSTTQELAVGTKRLDDTLLLGLDPPVPTAEGEDCATPVSEIEPAVALTTEPAKVTRTW